MPLFLKWECPICEDVCEDPNDFRQTSCHNGHVVQLGHEKGHGWQDATLYAPMPYVLPHIADEPNETEVMEFLVNMKKVRTAATAMGTRLLTRRH